MITIGVYDKHPVLRQALVALVGSANEDFRAVSLDHEPALAIGSIKTEGVNIVLTNLYHSDNTTLELIKQLTQRFERLRAIAILTEPDSRAFTLAIKNGTKGILSPGANLQELIQAILTVRNGFEYFSPQVTDLLVNQYVDGVVVD